MEGLVFGTKFSDHMLTVDWTAEEGWDAPQIVPYGPMALDPSACVFHYAVEVRAPLPRGGRSMASGVF